MKYILLTGGSGFVGRNLIEYFEAHYPGEFVIDAPRSKDLNVLDRDMVENWLLGKAKGSSILPGEKYDIVLHFAVYTDAVDPSKDGSKMYEYNKQSFLNFFENRHLCEKLFYAGSGAEFNKTAPIVSVTEEDLEGREIPVDPYGRMKYECGQLIETGENTYNLRIFGLFGKYEYPNRLITYLCNKSIGNEPFELNQDVYFDYLYIDDFCRMVHEILSKDAPAYHTYNMVSGQKVNLLRLVDIVNDIAVRRGYPAQNVTVRKEGLNFEYTASCRRFLREFSDFHFLSIEESVERLYEIYEEEKKKENHAENGADQEDPHDDKACGPGNHPAQACKDRTSSVEAQKTAENSGEGPSEEEIIRMLDALASGGASRMAIKVSEDMEAGSSRKAYHHGRCDVGSPFATGKLYDFEDGCE